MTTKLFISTLFLLVLLINPYSSKQSQISKLSLKKITDKTIEQDSFFISEKSKLEKLINVNKLIVNQLDQKVKILTKERIIYIRDTIIQEREIIKIDTIIKETTDTIIKRKKIIWSFLK